MDQTTIFSPGTKKLIQARLPFQPIRRTIETTKSLIDRSTAPPQPPSSSEQNKISPNNALDIKNNEDIIMTDCDDVVVVSNNEQQKPPMKRKSSITSLHEENDGLHEIHDVNDQQDQNEINIVENSADLNNEKEDDNNCIIIEDSQDSQQNDQQLLNSLKKYKKKHKYHKRLHIKLPLPKKRKISENINNIEPLKTDTEEDVVKPNELLNINENKEVTDISENSTEKTYDEIDLNSTTSNDDHENSNILRIITYKKDMSDDDVVEKRDDIDDKDIKLIDWQDDDDVDAGNDDGDTANDDQKPRESNKKESRLNDNSKELFSEVCTILKDNAVKQSEITAIETVIETSSTDGNESESGSDNKYTKEIKSVQIDEHSTPKQIRPDSSLLLSDSNRKLTPKQLKHREEMDKRQREKQLAKEERDRKIQEEKELRQRERDDKERQRKQEKEMKEELKKREREEKDEQRRKEKEEREQKRQAEIVAKNEERRKKEEQRDEERRKRDDEKKQKEEAELKAKKKASEAFTKFFVPTSKLQSPTILLSTSTTTTTTATIAANNDDEINAAIENLPNIKFMPFCIKGDMKLAPIKRKNLTDTERTSFEIKCLFGGGADDDAGGDKNNNTQLYLELMKNKNHIPIKTKNIKSNDDNVDEDDCLIIDDELEGATPIIEDIKIKQTYRAKYFKFHENQRPPYYGTWRKISNLIRPIKPFVKDQKYFDYDIDSDDEWEEEEPGESLHGSDDEKDKNESGDDDDDGEDDYDIDNEFFVPHGHLSDEEIQNNNGGDDDDDDDDDNEINDNSPAAQKAKLEIIQRVFDAEMKKKTEKLKPRLIGLIWQNMDGTKPINCSNTMWQTLETYKALFNGDCILIKPKISGVVTDSTTDGNSNDYDDNGILYTNNNNNSIATGTTNSNYQKRIKITDEVIYDLLKLIHGNTNNIKFLIKEFRAYMLKKNIDNKQFQEFSNISIRNKIKELGEWRACPDDGPLFNKYCWYTLREKRQLYGLDNFPVPNAWEYILSPKQRTNIVNNNNINTMKGKLSNIILAKHNSEKIEKKNVISSSATSSIVVEDLTTSTTTTESTTTPTIQQPNNRKKKYPILMSVPCGKTIPIKIKNNLISQYLKETNKKKSTEITETTDTNTVTVTATTADDDDNDGDDEDDNNDSIKKKGTRKTSIDEINEPMDIDNNVILD